MQKASTPILILVGILIVIALGGVYYIGFDHGWEKSVKKSTPKEECYYQQVQCIQAPCDPILICPSDSKDEGVACTQDAKLCPDGSSVGRTGPDCEFSLCPSSTN